MLWSILEIESIKQICSILAHGNNNPRAFGLDHSLGIEQGGLGALLCSISTGLGCISGLLQYSYLPVDETESKKSDEDPNNGGPEINTVEAAGRIAAILSFCCLACLCYYAPIANSIWRFYVLILSGIVCLWVCFSVFFTWLFDFREWRGL